MKSLKIYEPETKAEVIERQPVLPAPGTWHWLNTDKGKLLCCVIERGTNYVKVQAPAREREFANTWRVHISSIERDLRPEYDASSYIAAKITEHREEVHLLLGRIKEETAKLGIVERAMIADKPGDTNSQALVTLSAQTDVKQYEKSLIKAKEDVLPKLFEAVKKANSEVAKWMSAELLPLKASTHGMQDCVEEIEDRIFNVSLYAGLVESVQLVKEGDSASIDEKLHVMQTRLYMDEECLVNYRHGGMEFDDIGQFDEWLSEEENFNRVLPFPRCIVSFKVRRYAKERITRSLQDHFINMRLDQQAQFTFLYIRNGEKLFRLNTELDFGHKLFPDREILHPGEVSYFRKREVHNGKNPDFSMISESEYWEMVNNAIKVNMVTETFSYFHSWENFTNPSKKSPWKRGCKFDASGYAEYRINRMAMPSSMRRWSRGRGSFTTEWEQFTSASLYYDDACKSLDKKMKLYNRVVLILQGLFDRSEVLHPHKQPHLWKTEDFDNFLKLIYDGDMVIEYGDPPSFEEYWEKCNAKTTKDSVMIGQEKYWEEVEAERENNRMYSRRRYHDHAPYKRFRPPGNEGPGYIAKMTRFMPTAKKCVFSWMREKYTGRYGDMTRATITVPLEKLFNASAYTPGDYKMFFADPRTREDYIDWAPFLLAAEEFHAGSPKMQPQLPQ